MEDRGIRKLSRRTGAALLTIGLALGGFGVVAPTAFAHHDVGHEQGGNPNNQDENESGGAGNNGTVKINGTELEDEPGNGNDPKVQCPLIVTWEGFDTGERGTTVTIGEHKFNEGDTPVFQQAYSFSGGSYATTVTPDLSSLTPTPNNGFHLDVIVETALSVGQSVTKTKVIWADEACAGTTDPDAAEATIQVNKTVVGTTSETSFPFMVSCTTGTVTGSPMTVPVGGSSTATVSWDAEGTAPTCTVTETDTHGASSTTWTLDGTTTTGTVASVGSIDDGDTRVVTFTNTYTTQGRCTVNCDVIIPVVIPVVDTPAPVETPAPVTQVAGEQIVNPAPPAAPQAAPAPAPTNIVGAQLARTGAMTDRLIVLAGLFLVLGGITLVAGKERPTVAVAPTRRR